MLAALPGVREVRSALAGGYLWIFFFWLAIDPLVGKGDLDSEPYRSAHHLGDVLGPVALGIAISFVAYLIGTGVNELRGLLSSAYLRVRQSASSSLTAEERAEVLAEVREGREKTRALFVDSWSGLWGFLGRGERVPAEGSGSSIAPGLVWAYVREILRAIAMGIAMGLRAILGYGIKVDSVADAIADWTARLLIKAGADPYKPYLSVDGVANAKRYLAQTLPSSQDPPDVADLIADFPVLRMRLIHASPETASEVDRLNAEADFRSAITLPLLAIAAIFALKVSLLFLIFWPLLFALRMTARQRRYEAAELMVDALIQGVIEAPTVEMHLSESPNLTEGRSAKAPA